MTTLSEDCRWVLRKKSERYVRSAKGARYESQGQALSEAKRVAPGKQK